MPNFKEREETIEWAFFSLLKEERELEENSFLIVHPNPDENYTLEEKEKLYLNKSKDLWALINDQEIIIGKIRPKEEKINIYITNPEIKKILSTTYTEKDYLSYWIKKSGSVFCNRVRDHKTIFLLLEFVPKDNKIFLINILIGMNMKDKKSDENKTPNIMLLFQENKPVDITLKTPLDYIDLKDSLKDKIDE